MSGRLSHAKMRGLGALGALGDNYSATAPSQCGPDEMWIQDVGCVTRGSPGQAGSDSGSSVWNALTGGGGQPTGGVSTPSAGSSGGSNWLTALIQGGVQVGAAAVTGQNPFYPHPTTKPGGFFSGSTPWIIGGIALAAILLMRRRSSAA